MRFSRLLTLGLLLTAAAAAAESPLLVTTRSGVLEGRQIGAIRAYLGIPYAAPPVGPGRWQPPQPAKPWAGVKAATEFGARPMQAPLHPDMVFRDAGPSEDCLTLNIWTPAKRARDRLPVMVWIFGDDFQAGGTSEQRQDGTHLAERGVVVVSVNYRLGVFGFLVHPELIAESPHHAAGNYGLLDQLAALRWVHDNIAAFGGDPGNVTIFGESAGAMSVSAHMASPLSRGLFRQAIGESGALGWKKGALDQRPVADRARDDAALIAQLTRTHSLAELRAMPPEALLAAVASARPSVSFRPVVDGWFLPQSVPQVFAAGKQNDVPLLAGWNRDESGLALGTDQGPAQDQLHHTADADFGTAGSEFLRLYPADTPEKAARAGAEYAADNFIGYGTWAWIETAAKTGHQAVYRYRFDHAPPADFFGRNRGVYHSADILYVFGQFDAQPQVHWTDADRAVSDVIQSYWVNFAQYGNPNGTGLPTWPRYTAADKGKVLHLEAAPVARRDEFRARYLFLAREWHGTGIAP